jgi:hypothetical protein
MRAALGLVGFLGMTLAVAAEKPPPSPADEAGTPPLGYVCARASSPVRIDGRLDDEAWQSAPWTADFVDIEGAKKPRPRFRTRAKMLWDDEFFYVAADLEEPHVWGTLAKHDSVIFHDNDFEVFLDPDGDSHEYYEFEINALNTSWDLFLPRPYKDGGRALNGWEIDGLKTAVHVAGTLNDARDHDRGWSVEIAFPWKALGEQARTPAPPRDGDQWRVNFSRVQWLHVVVQGKYHKVAKRREDNWVWSPQGVIDMHRPERWGYVQFSTAPPGRASFRPDPAGAVRQALHRVYYAQHQYRERHGRWAATLGELGFAQGDWAGLGQAPLLEVTQSGYECSVEQGRAGERRRRWHIREDARIWGD